MFQAQKILVDKNAVCREHINEPQGLITTCLSQWTLTGFRHLVKTSSFVASANLSYLYFYGQQTWTKWPPPIHVPKPASLHSSSRNSIFLMTWLVFYPRQLQRSTTRWPDCSNTTLFVVSRGSLTWIAMWYTAELMSKNTIVRSITRSRTPQLNWHVAARLSKKRAGQNVERG